MSEYIGKSFDDMNEEDMLEIFGCNEKEPDASITLASFLGSFLISIIVG